MGKDVGFGNVQEVEHPFEIFAYRLRCIVVAPGDRGLRSTSEINSDDGVILRKDWANGIECQL